MTQDLPSNTDPNDGDCQEFRELIQGELLGELSQTETNDLAEHLADCPACRAEQEMSTQDWNLIADSAEAAAPPPEVLTGLLKQIEKEKKASAATREAATPSARRPSPRWAALAAYGGMAAAAMLAGLLFTTLFGPASPGPDKIAAQRSDAERRIAEALARFAPNGVEPGVEVHQASFEVHTGQINADTPVNAAILLQRAAGQAHFFATGLPAAPDGMVYRLWLLGGDDKWRYAGDLGNSGEAHKLLAEISPQESLVEAVLTVEPDAPAGDQPDDDKRLLRLRLSQ